MPHLRVRSYALFFAVMAENADQRCSTFLAAAVRAGDLFLVMLGNGQNTRKGLLAGVAEGFVVGAHGPPTVLKGDSRILDPLVSSVQPGSGHEFRVPSVRGGFGRFSGLDSE